MNQIKKVNSYSFIFNSVLKSGKLYVFSLFLSILVSGCHPIVNQQLLKIIISKLEVAFSSGALVPTKNFIIIVFIYAGFTFFRENVSNIQRGVRKVLGLKFVNNMQNILIDKVRHTDYKNFYIPEFQNNYSFALLNISKEPTRVIYSVASIFTSLIQIIGSAILFIRLNVFILLGILLIFFLKLIVTVRIQMKYVKMEEDLSLNRRKMNYFFDVLTGKKYIKELKIFKMCDFFKNIRNSIFKKINFIWSDLGRYEFRNRFSLSVLSSSIVIVIILWMIDMTLRKELKLSDFIFYSGLIFSIQGALNSLTEDISMHKESVTFVDKFLNFVYTDHSIKSGNIKIEKNKLYTIEFKNVSFKYQNDNTYTLKNISFRINPGERVSIVGRNGCGKTTLVNLLMRIYDTTNGNILVDGVDIKEYDYEDYLSLFSTVFQDYQQYSFKLVDYVSSGSVQSPENLLKIKKSAIMTAADQFIEKTPQGWESNLTTRFDKSGLELSGGQWQKLAVARAFCLDVPILIFDEPTSAMDAISESRIYESIKNIGEDKTVIFISHRMYSSKIASKIIYMESGEIKNIGTHDELMKDSLGYRNLFEEQANRY